MIAPLFSLLALVASSPLVNANVPLVDFDRMGKVGLVGAFAGLDIFQNSSLTFDPTTSTLLARSPDGALSPLASTNAGGRILAGCSLANVFYFAGVFSSIGGMSALNVASYDPSSGKFSALASSGPNGEVDSVFCDTTSNKLWVGGAFTSPASAVAVWDPTSKSWAAPPFTGVTGRVLSITSNSSDASLFFAGSFITSFGSGTTILNGTNNPNVPFSAGATPFSSSLVPIPLADAQVDGSPSSSLAGFTNITNILCPAGPDGPGNSWFGGDGSTALLTVRTFTFISASGVRLGNTFQSNHGTTGFSVTTIPDNTVQVLQYLDPTTGQNKTCSDPCPLSTDSSILYQDFLFSSTLPVTGVQIKLSEWSGDSPGLHLLQLLSAGAFASSIEQNNVESCFAPNPSNTTRTGNWQARQVNTDIAGTTQTVLVSDVDVGTQAPAGPSFTWMPYVSASGNYDVHLLVPGCTDLQDCPMRTSVKVTVFPGAGLAPSVNEVSQQNTDDTSIIVYSGPILPTSSEFVTTISMTLADNPAGNGQNGLYELVADRVELVLKSANVSSSNGSGSSGNGTSVGAKASFGFFEWPRSMTSTTTIDGTKALPNSSFTSLDTLGVDLLNGLGGASALTSLNNVSIAAVVHHPSGVIFVAGQFSLQSNGSENIIAFKNGALTNLAGGGLDGPVSSMVLLGDQLFVGGSFKDTRSGSTQGHLNGIAVYDVQKDSWSSLGAGVNGEVTDLGLTNGQVQVTGNFTNVIASSTVDLSLGASGFAAWDIKSSSWVNSGGFLAGSMTYVGNGSSSQFVAGNVIASRKIGATGMVMLTNGNSSGPVITPLGAVLSGTGVSSASTATSRRRRSHIPRAMMWMSHSRLSGLFKRQSNADLIPLPSAPPATAPAVLAGAFWTNSSSAEVAILGGNFSFVAPGSSASSDAVAFYDSASGTLQGLAGPQINGTVHALLVVGDQLYIGGQFTIPGASVSGMAIYDLSKQQWDVSGLQPLQSDNSSTVIVRSISTSSSKANTIIAAGSFSQAGSLPCQSICSLDIATKQWNALGNGLKGDVSSIAYAGNNQDVLIAGGSIALSGNSASNVVQFSFSNNTWSSVGVGSDLPGPVTALEVNAGNASSIFAAGQSSDGKTPYLAFWNGAQWANLGSTLQSNTIVSQLTMVPLQDTHASNGVIQPDRMLMVSGSLADSTFGNVSTALFDGESFFPYILSTSATGSSGVVSSLFRSFSTFSFNQRHFLAVGVVILISIAIAAGVVFLLALIGIVWTLFSRRDDKLGKFDPGADDDADSTHHRPSSLLEHINAATRTTILGASPFSNFNSEKEEEKLQGDNGNHDPFGPDASNYIRAETPSDAVGGILAEEQSRPAHARYSFDGTGEGELAISAGAEIEVLDDRDPAWWYARDVRTGREGVVPAAYLY